MSISLEGTAKYPNLRSTCSHWWLGGNRTPLHCNSHIIMYLLYAVYLSSYYLLFYLDMNDNGDNKGSITVTLFHTDGIHIEEIKDDNIFDDKLKTSLYDKDNEEMYIATSPPFSTVDTKSPMVDLYDTQHDLCDEKSDPRKVTTECDEQFELHNKSISADSFATVSQTIEYSSIKASDTYPVINDSNSYFVTADYSHMNIDVSKAYFYVLSPSDSGSGLLRSSVDEPLIRVNSDHLISVTNSDSKCLDNDQVTPCISEHRLSSDDDDVIRDSANLSEFDHNTSEHIDLVQTEIDGNEETVHGHFDNLSGDLHFINGIENSVDDPSKERSHLIWQPLSPGEQEVC